MYACRWRQVTVAFSDWPGAENVAVAQLAPLLATAEDDGLLASWFFVRKAPCWRIRYRPDGPDGAAHAYIHRHLADLARDRHVEGITEVVYEPETHAFGGSGGMTSAHRLFHLDSRHLLAYLAATRYHPGTRHRRELSIILCSTLMRAAGLDWYEEGDVWARVAEHREPPEQIPANRRDALHGNLRRLLTADTASAMREGSSMAFAAEWAGAYAHAGRELADLARSGMLHRGLRAILAHHIIFAWNRHGLPHQTQTVLANTARTVVFGRDPTAQPPTETGDQPWTAPARH